jgi:hypothetical protein
MAKRTTVKSSIDTGTPPASVTRARLSKEKLTSSESVVVHDSDPPVPITVPSSENVKLEHALYSVSFGALDVSISDHQIAIKIPKTTTFKFEPKVDSKFVVVYRNRSYDAVYLGGIFNFDSDNSWAITFILEGKQDAGEKQSDRGE